MLGPDTRAITRSKMGTNAIDDPGSDQSGKHLLGSIPGSEDAHEDALYDLEEEAMRMDGLAEKMGSENETERERYEERGQGRGVRSTRVRDPSKGTRDWSDDASDTTFEESQAYRLAEEEQ